MIETRNIEGKNTLGRSIKQGIFIIEGLKLSNICGSLSSKWGSEAGYWRCISWMQPLVSAVCRDHCIGAIFVHRSYIEARSIQAWARNMHQKGLQA